jgi:uncharacterized protein YcfL
MNRLLLILAVTLAASGCTTGANFAKFDSKSKAMTIGPINDSGLQSDAEILPGGQALYQEQLMNTQVEVQSHSNSKQKLYYQWRWFDSDNFPLGEDAWHWIQLDPNDKKMLTGIASQARATRAEFLLRRPSSEDHEN